jgi:hypothetical protein
MIRARIPDVNQQKQGVRNQIVSRCSIFGVFSSRMDKNINQLWSELEGAIRREPQKSVLLAFAGGFFLCLLPLGRVLGILVRVLFVLFKPALLILGLVKFLEYAGCSSGTHK